MNWIMYFSGFSDMEPVINNKRGDELQLYEV
jgi:hypothetical protein